MSQPGSNIVEKHVEIDNLFEASFHIRSNFVLMFRLHIYITSLLQTGDIYGGGKWLCLLERQIGSSKVQQYAALPLVSLQDVSMTVLFLLWPTEWVFRICFQKDSLKVSRKENLVFTCDSFPNEIMNELQIWKSVPPGTLLHSLCKCKYLLVM